MANQINVLELNRATFQRRNRERECFTRVLELCYNRIRRTNGVGSKTCVYDIPLFLEGRPLFDCDACMRYVVRNLAMNGFRVHVPERHRLVISWSLSLNPALGGHVSHSPHLGQLGLGGDWSGGNRDAPVHQLPPTSPLVLAKPLPPRLTRRQTPPPPPAALPQAPPPRVAAAPSHQRGAGFAHKTARMLINPTRATTPPPLRTQQLPPPFSPPPLPVARSTAVTHPAFFRTDQKERAHDMPPLSAEPDIWAPPACSRTSGNADVHALFERERKAREKEYQTAQAHATAAAAAAQDRRSEKASEEDDAPRARRQQREQEQEGNAINGYGAEGRKRSTTTRRPKRTQKQQQQPQPQSNVSAAESGVRPISDFRPAGRFQLAHAADDATSDGHNSWKG